MFNRHSTFGLTPQQQSLSDARNSKPTVICSATFLSMAVSKDHKSFSAYTDPRCLFVKKKTKRTALSGTMNQTEKVSGLPSR